jgi:hypothetical protein
VNVIDKKIEELEEKIMSQFKARMQAMEKKNKELKENLQKVLNMVNMVSEQIICSQKTQEMTTEKHMEVLMSQFKMMREEATKIEKKRSKPAQNSPRKGTRKEPCRVRKSDKNKHLTRTESGSKIKAEKSINTREDREKKEASDEEVYNKREVSGQTKNLISKKT